MKIAPSKNNPNPKKAPLLPLIPDPLDEMTAENSVSYSLRTNPTDADSAKYKKTVRVLSGTESIRTVLRWSADTTQVLRGLNVTTGPEKYDILQDLLSNSALAVFRKSIETHTQTAFDTYVTAGTTAAARVDRRNEGRRGHVTNDIILTAKRELMSSLIPKKAVTLIKRYLRREARKPADMKVRAYYQHLVRMNSDEIPCLPPFGLDQNLPDDEITDILVYGTPRSWSREMDRQGFDPMTHTSGEVVDFMEQIEASEDFDGQRVDNNKGKSNNNNNNSKKKGNSSKEGKWCMLHGKGSHTTDECNTLKEQTKKLKGNHEKSGKSYGNKTWSRKASESTSSSKKELAAFIKKSIADGVRKELHAIDKKRKASSDDESSVESHDLHAFDKNPKSGTRPVKSGLEDLLDGELKDFNYKDMDNLKISEDDEVSV